MDCKQGDIWTEFNKETNPDKWIVITTNGFIKNNLENVMGRGIAKQAAQRFPLLPLELGKRIWLDGNILFTFPEYRVITFPVKVHWNLKAETALISRSAYDLNTYITHEISKGKDPIIYITKVGCGNGQLKWDIVEPILDKYLSKYEDIIKLMDIN